MASLYKDLVRAKIPTDHHESDLYVLDTPEARETIKKYGYKFKTFTSCSDGKRWIDVPFAYEPFWEKAATRKPRSHTTKRRATGKIPGIAAWNMFAGGTGAAPDKHGYSLHLPEGEYHVAPVSSQRGRHRGYSLMFAARQQPRGGHSGLWHDLGMHRSPAQAAVAARKHHVASY